MFGIFDQSPRCPVCGRKMVNVIYYQVPSAAKREFARMNRYRPLSQYGWYYCAEDELHIHKHTVEAANIYRR